MARRRVRYSWGIIALYLALSAVGLVAAFFTFVQVPYRVAVGPAGSESQRFFSVLAPIFAAESTFIRITSLPHDDAQAISDALQAGDADLAIVRTDLAIPENGRTIATLRREPVLLIVPANTKIEKVAELKGKAIGVLKGHGQNSRILDIILNYYQVPPETVQRVTLAANEVGAAIRQKRIAAMLVIGPIGPGVVADVVAGIGKAGNGAPDFLAVEEAEAIAKRSPPLEKIEIARGALQGNPPVPDETITTVAVSYRLVARSSLMDWTAGEMARVLFTNKAKIAAELPFAYQIEAPETDKDAILPVHPGAAVYLKGDQKGFYDTFESLFWMGWMLCTLIGVSYAAIRSRINRNKRDATTQATDRAIAMLSEVRCAPPNRLEALEQEADQMLEWSLQQRANDAMDQERFQFLSQALGHVRQAIDRQRLLPRQRALKAASN